ncbi:MAG: hypothetical protein IT425_13230 [Pirellulales bacterium]|nr:hypothetical protein [Pirellulales bacterium]
MEPNVDIAFDCLPLRLVGRVDVPLDASPTLRTRSERLRAALVQFEIERAYYLYNTRCTFRLANSEIDNMLRFSFEGVVLTDRSDCKANQAELSIELVAETCGGVPATVYEWLQGTIRRAVLIEFDRFIAAGQLANRVAELGTVENATSLSGFGGLGV